MFLKITLVLGIVGLAYSQAASKCGDIKTELKR